MAETGLTRSEALSFLADIICLEIPRVICSGTQKPDKLFLNSIIQTFMEHIPFQSVTLIADDLKKRHVPTWSEIKLAMFKKQGGVCHAMNAFMFYLLKSLGYDVVLGYATAVRPEDHIIIFVRNLQTSGDTYLVDVGYGYPSFEAISLNFDVESPVFRHSYLEFKYFKENGKIFRAHGKGDSRFEKEPEPWRAVYEFTTDNTRSFDKFPSAYHNAYTNIDGMTFQRSLRAVQYPNGKALVILHENILCEDGGPQLKKAHLPDDEALIQAYLTHFPQFEEETVKLAVKNWRNQLKVETQ